MRTQTIYRAMSEAYRTIIFTQTVDAFLTRKARQWAKFDHELLRRMDERDAIVPLARRVGDAHLDWVVSADGIPEKDAHAEWDEASFILGGYMNHMEAE